MANETIIIDIAIDGTVKIDAQGFTGSACDVTKVLEEDLGIENGKRTVKAEAYRTATNTRKVAR